ncbi:MAG: hypothetical protein KA004_01650 [Verrucomicrobiales bacterium]|nr:hypothetical protein [Verrucomicrobiales bacterium]
MPKIDFDSAVEKITQRDTRYAPEAFALVRDALDEISRKSATSQGEVTHVRGPELAEGFRQHALRQFGPMVPTLLEMWGMRCTRDIGEVVFLLIGAGVFSRSPEDKLEDFDGLFDFEQAFIKPFLPSSAGPAVRK